MGFYIRKSLKFGPFRLNLSKNGLGVSTGITVARIGMGPRGAYVHLGRGGLYYRKTLVSPGGRTRNRSSSRRQEDEVVSEGTPAEMTSEYDPSLPMAQEHFGDVAEMVDADSAEMVAEISQKQKKSGVFSGILILVLIMGVVSLIGAIPPWIIVPSMVFWTGVAIWAYQWDDVNKYVVLMYDLEEEHANAYRNLYQSIESFSQCDAAWYITQRRWGMNPRYNGGGDMVINRKKLTIGSGNPPAVRTNLSVPSIAFSGKTLWFLPDRILIYTQNNVGAFEYSSVNFAVQLTQYTEFEQCLSDAMVVNHTWRYVNRDGSSDRRFRNNFQIPICQYEELQMTGPGGFQVTFLFSHSGPGTTLRSAVQQLEIGIQNAERKGSRS